MRLLPTGPVPAGRGNGSRGQLRRVGPSGVSASTRQAFAGSSLRLVDTSRRGSATVATSVSPRRPRRSSRRATLATAPHGFAATAPSRSRPSTSSRSETPPRGHCVYCHNRRGRRWRCAERPAGTAACANFCPGVHPVWIHDNPRVSPGHHTHHGRLMSTRKTLFSTPDPTFRIRDTTVGSHPTRRAFSLDIHGVLVRIR
jgi:hypothetical protein